MNDRQMQLRFAADPSAEAPVPYEVVRSKRKTLALHISHNRVEVRCPLRVAKREISKFVEDHRDWIHRRLREEAGRAMQVMRLEHGGQIFYRGKELGIVFREGEAAGVVIEDGRFIFQGRDITPATAKRMLTEHLTHSADAYLPPRARALAEHLGVASKLKNITLRKTRSKWGHCTVDGVIQFNWLIMLAPDAIIDYLIAHEVCHLIHLNHSPRYWRLVRSLCPDTKRYVRWLNQNQHRFWF